MTNVTGNARLSLIAEMARWDDRGETVLVPVICDRRRFECAITHSAVQALLERMATGQRDCFDAVHRHSTRITTLALQKIEAGAIGPNDTVTIEHGDVIATARPRGARIPARPQQ